MKLTELACQTPGHRIICAGGIFLSRPLASRAYLAPLLTETSRVYPVTLLTESRHQAPFPPPPFVFP